MIVFVPVSKGTDEATQSPTPVAVPVAPPKVCHVKVVTPVPPEAVPASEIVAELTVTTTDAGEVIPVPAIAPVPLTKPWYTGVANVRGNLYSIIDFSMFIGAAPAIRSERSRLVLISDKYRVGCALLIDAIVGLRSPHLFDRVTDTADAAQWVKARYTDREKNVWNELAVAHLIQDAGFLDIGVSLRQL